MMGSPRINAFRKFDKDGDKHISLTEFKKEIKSIMKELGTNMSKGEIKNGFKLIDLNANCKITLKKFVGVDFYIFGNSSLEKGKLLAIPNNGYNLTEPDLTLFFSHNY